MIELLGFKPMIDFLTNSIVANWAVAIGTLALAGVTWWSVRQDSVPRLIVDISEGASISLGTHNAESGMDFQYDLVVKITNSGKVPSVIDYITFEDKSGETVDAIFYEMRDFEGNILSLNVHRHLQKDQEQMSFEFQEIAPEKEYLEWKFPLPIKPGDTYRVWYHIQMSQSEYLERMSPENGYFKVKIGYGSSSGKEKVKILEKNIEEPPDLRDKLERKEELRNEAKS